MSLDPRIYPSLPEYTLLFNKCICATLPESTPPSQNVPLLLNNYMRPSHNLPLPHRIYHLILCDPPRFYPALPEYTPFSTTIILCDPPRIYPPSQKLPPFQQIYMGDPPVIYPSLPESTPLSTTICDSSRIYPSLPEYNPFSTNLYGRPFQNLPFPPRIYPSPLFNNCMRTSFQNLPLPPRIYPPFQQLYATLH